MKNTFAKLILISGAAFGTALMAQTPDAPPPQVHHAANPQQQLNRLTKKLALTADQQSQLLPILTSRDEQVSTIESDTTLTPKAYDQMVQEERERAKARKQATVSN